MYLKLKAIPYSYLLAVPVLLFLFGVASNQAVLIANWGKFPVMLNQQEIAQMQHQADESDFDSFTVTHTAVPKSARVLDQNGEFIDDVHSIMGHNSNLKALADIWNLGNAIYSFGDFLIILGVFLLSFTPIAWATLVLRKAIVEAL